MSRGPCENGACCPDCVAEAEAGIALTLTSGGGLPPATSRLNECVEYVRTLRPCPDSGPEPQRSDIADPERLTRAVAAWEAKKEAAEARWLAETHVEGVAMLARETQGKEGSAYDALVRSLADGATATKELRASARVLRDAKTKVEMTMSNQETPETMTARVNMIQRRDRCSRDAAYVMAAREAREGIPVLLTSDGDSGDVAADRNSKSLASIREAYEALWPRPVGAPDLVAAWVKARDFSCARLFKDMQAMRSTEAGAQMTAHDDAELLALTFAEHVDAVCARDRCSRNEGYTRAHAARRAAEGGGR